MVVEGPCSVLVVFLRPCLVRATPSNHRNSRLQFVSYPQSRSGLTFLQSSLTYRRCFPTVCFQEGIIIYLLRTLPTCFCYFAPSICCLRAWMAMIRYRSYLSFFFVFLLRCCFFVSLVPVPCACALAGVPEHVHDGAVRLEGKDCHARDG